MSSLNTLKILMRNQFVAVIFSGIALVIVQLVSPQTWVTLVSIIVSYIAFDIIGYFLIRGGGGHAKSSFTGNEFLPKGYAYFIFILSIIFGTLAGGYIIDNILPKVFITDNPINAIVLNTVPIVVVTWIYFHTRFYNR